MILLHGAAYAKTILERAKGSALDIIATHADTVSVITLLPPHNKQITCLYFEGSYWVDIQRFSEIDFGPFLLLRTLLINAVKELNPDSPSAMTSPSLPLFGNAVNLEEFSFHSEGSPSLSHFVFPSLTAFELSATQAEGFRVSQLLDFLEASPMLQKVHMKIISDILFEGIPQERLVTLPNLENLHLAVTDGGPGYKITAHVSCPHIKYTSLVHGCCVDDGPPQEMYPRTDSWNAIVRQYSVFKNSSQGSRTRDKNRPGLHHHMFHRLPVHLWDLHRILFQSYCRRR